MFKPPFKKYFDQFGFVVLTTSVLYVSLLLLDYYSVISDHGISILHLNINGTKHDQVPTPPSSNFSLNSSESNVFPSKIGTYAIQNQNNVTNVASNNTPRYIIEKKKLDPCSGKYIYVYDLPKRFNEDLIKGCHTLMKWGDMCPYMTNLGLGPKVIVSKSNLKVLSKNGWYQTNQFSLEVIFHNSMKHYKCLTKNSSLASAMYVPYYAGLDVGQYLWEFNASMRDSSPMALMKWLSKQPEWERMWGRDHFMVGGRIGYDFRREIDDDSVWGTKLMFLPEANNMSFLPIESATYDNDFAIPYPTYFHPSKDTEIFRWQGRMRRAKRPFLFSFAGASRPSSAYSIRGEIIKQCKSSKRCNLLGCYNAHKNICDDPVSVLRVFQRSVFCLQPPGDSYTRRSTFDSILAGCIPVFFHPMSAYKQYLWHLPKEGSSYSVYIPEGDIKNNKVIINETLSRISHSEVLAMREEVIRLIPRVIYHDPSSRLKTIEDAFDIAVKGILGRIEATRGESTSG